MANRGRGEAPKAGRGKPRLSPEPESPGQPVANVNADATLLQSMRKMMNEMRSDILSKFETTVSTAVKREIVAALEPFENRLASYGESIADLELSANAHDTELSDLRANVSKLTATVDSLSKKCEDLESRSRWNNIRLVGLPEGTEGPRPTEFTAQLLQDILGLDDKPMLDRAHRTLRTKPKDGEPPRPLVMRVNLFQVRNQILRRAGEASPLSYMGRRISIFPDFTPAVAKKRAAFATVKKELHSCPNVKFGLLYPATLRITLPGGQTHRFEDPALASDFIEKNIKKGVTPDSI